jgi:hypothetical protein
VATSNFLGFIIIAFIKILLMLTASKQVVFGGDYTLTFNLNELDGRCFYRPTKSGDPEMWMSLPKIKATNAYASAAGTVGGAVYCFQNCDYITSPTIASATGGTGGNGVHNTAGAGLGGSVYCFQKCDYIDSAIITAATSGNGGNTSYDGYLYPALGGAVYGFQNCDYITSPTITSATVNLGWSANASAYGFYNSRNIDHPEGIISGYNAYLHYNWSGPIENRSGSTAKTALFYPDYGPYDLTFTSNPTAGQPVTLEWRIISPSGGLLTGKSAPLQVTLNKGVNWTNIYSGTATSYTVPADAESIRFRLISAGTVYSAFADLTHVPVISGEDGYLGTFSTSFTPYEFSVSKSDDDPDDWTSANITPRLDDRVLAPYVLALSTAKTIAFTGTAWKKIRNGAHMLKIEARRIIGGRPSGFSSFRTLTFA